MNVAVVFMRHTDVHLKVERSLVLNMQLEILFHNDVFGLFSCSGCEIYDGENGVHLTYSREGRASGEAFVEFASEDDLEKGLTKNNDHMGQRYIEGDNHVTIHSYHSLSF